MNIGCIFYIMSITRGIFHLTLPLLSHSFYSLRDSNLTYIIISYVVIINI